MHTSIYQHETLQTYAKHCVFFYNISIFNKFKL